MENPFSKQSQAETYWANTRTTDDLEAFIEKYEFALRGRLETLLRGDGIESEINDHLTYKNLFSNPENFWTLLFAAGYLTIKESSFANERQQLILPNREIREFLIKIVNQVFSKFI